ncbi:MAG: cytochrome C oxidase subunit IV family protein [Phycisphaerales bacterium]|jgi:cytochrome c oxidase subunit 4|nr:cytochrome C oxidase subunit IV family protein [Phycisphaerales bacterium]
MSSQHVISAKLYTVIYILLMVLLVVTVGGDLMFESAMFRTSFALGIAVIKALLVVLFFMHVRYSSRLTWVFAGAAFVWLFILFALTFNDYFTRGTAPERLFEAPVGGIVVRQTPVNPEHEPSSVMQRH